MATSPENSPSSRSDVGRNAGEIDQREQWLILGISDYFRGIVKSDKVQKFITSPSFLDALHSFADSPDVLFLAFEESPGNIKLHTQPPAKVIGKTLYYLKVRAGSLGSEKYRSQVIVGDLSQDLRQDSTRTNR